MGDGCKPENLKAILKAARQGEGLSGIQESEIVSELTADQAYHYENTMVDIFGLGEMNERQGNSRLDSVINYRKGLIPGRTGEKGDYRSDSVDGQFYDAPSLVFDPAFYRPIDRMMVKWTAKGADKATYEKEVGSKAKAVLKSINEDIAQASGIKDLSRRLQRYGLTPETAYEAKDWLQWIAGGGHTTGKRSTLIYQIGSNLSKAQASWNMTWSIGNIADMTRIMGRYTLKPKVLAQGIKDTFKDGLLSGFKEQTALKRGGLYDNQDIQRSLGNNNIFGWSVTLQKNLAYNLNKADGGDGWTGVARDSFDFKPWDQPRVFRSQDESMSSLVWGLARFPINESRWYLKSVITGGKALPKLMNGTASQYEKDTISQLLTHHIAKQIMFGSKAVIPAIFWGMLTKEQKETVKEVDDHLGINVAKRASKELSRLMGFQFEMDFGDFMQPLGGNLGGRLGAIGRTFTEAGELGAKVINDMAQGKADASAINAVAAGMTLLNLGLAPVPPKLGNFEVDMINSTTITRLLKTHAKNIEEEYAPDRAARELLKAVFGQAVKKGEGESSSGRSRGRSRRSTRSRRRG